MLKHVPSLENLEPDPTLISRVGCSNMFGCFQYAVLLCSDCCATTQSMYE